MANIYLGGTDLSSAALKLGSTDVAGAYLGGTLVWSPAAAGDADANAWIAQVNTDGGSLSATAEAAVTQLATDLKATTGLWTNLRAIYPLVGNNNASCKYNLKDASTSFTYTMNFQGGWTYNANGVTGNGSDTSGRTTLSPSILAGLGTGAGLHIYLTVNPTNQTGATSYDWGTDEQSVIAGFNNTTLYGKYGGGGYLTSGGQVPQGAVGDFYSSQNDTSTTFIYKNGSSVASRSEAVGSGVTDGWALGNDNRGGGSFPEPGIKGYGFAAISNYLSSAQMTAFNTAVQTYNSSLSR